VAAPSPFPAPFVAALPIIKNQRVAHAERVSRMAPDPAPGSGHFARWSW